MPETLRKTVFLNRSLNSSFIVRKVSSGEGVERTFQLYSPLIASIEVKRRGDVRRAKLYYLRDRSGKSARIKEKLPGRTSKDRSADVSAKTTVAAAATVAAVGATPSASTGAVAGDAA